MTERGSITLWIERLKDGDQEAAQHVWERYYHRLVGLARKKLGDSPRGVKDEDDVVQSAFKSFCLRAKAGQFPDLRDRDNLWPLLVLITARKASNQRQHERRAKRGGGRVANQPAKDAADSDDLGFADVKKKLLTECRSKRALNLSNANSRCATLAGLMRYRQ